MIEKIFIEIQGAFMVKIRDNTFNGTIGENTFEHINNFLKVVGPIKINGVSQDRFRLSIFPKSHSAECRQVYVLKKDCILLQLQNTQLKGDDPDDIAEIFKIEGNLFDYETPLCKTFNDFNYLLKIDTDLFTFDIQGIRTYEEYELSKYCDKGICKGTMLDNADAIQRILGFEIRRPCCKEINDMVYSEKDVC
ncbi:hypothetical protein Tco_0609081 [Tanacetum coccineum]